MTACVRLAAALCAAAFAVAAPARAGIVYDEAVSGDLSGDGLVPTSVALAPGSNQVLGVTGRVGLEPDRDYFTVTVPAGHAFVSLVELAGTNANAGVSFLGIEAGNQVTVPSFASTAEGLLGWSHWADTDVDLEILATVGASELGATGFTPPLPAGDYAFWIQDFGDGNANYGFDIVIAVPEPGAAGLVLLACAALARSRTRRPRA